MAYAQENTITYRAIFMLLTNLMSFFYPKRAISDSRTLRCLSWNVMDAVASRFARWFQKPRRRHHIQTWVSCLLVWSLSSYALLGTRDLGRYLDVWVAVLEAASARRKCQCFPAHQQQRHKVLHDLKLGFKCLTLAPAFVCSTPGNTLAAEAGTSLTSVQNSLC